MVIAGAAAYDVARMVQMLADDIPIPLAIFTEVEEAEQRLRDAVEPR